MSIIFYCSSISGSRRDWSRSEHMTRGSAHHATRVDVNLVFFLHIISYILGIMLCAEIMSTHIQRCHIYNTEKQTLFFSFFWSFRADGLICIFRVFLGVWEYIFVFQGKMSAQSCFLCLWRLNNHRDEQQKCDTQHYEWSSAEECLLDGYHHDLRLPGRRSLWIHLWGRRRLLSSVSTQWNIFFFCKLLSL